MFHIAVAVTRTLPSLEQAELLTDDALTKIYFFPQRWCPLIGMAIILSFSFLKQNDRCKKNPNNANACSVTVS